LAPFYNASILFSSVFHPNWVAQVSRVGDYPLLSDTPIDSLVIGFYVNWDENADNSLQQNIQHLNRFMPEWIHLVDANGTIADDNLVKENQVLSYIQQQRPDLQIIPLINSFDPQTGQWNSQQLGQMLNNPNARDRTIQNLLQFVQKNHLAGISIDFEDAPPDSQQGLQAFMQELYARFHPFGLEVALSIPLANAAFDGPTYAQSCDYLILVAYDEHWISGKPGPVASQAWFQSGLKKMLSKINPRKVVVAIGNYGYDWSSDALPGKTITFQEAVQSASDTKAAIIFDPTSLNPTFSYVGRNGQSHVVWYLDAVTAFNQVTEGLHYNVRGFALWRLGSEDPSVWQVLKQQPVLDAKDAASLKSLDFGYVINYEGQGEVLKISGLPERGSREITLDPDTGQILSEKMDSFPSTYTITRWGRKNKEIALTFDDGPDSIYTPQILTILKNYHVPGTFFIIGVNGEQHPDLLHQIVDQGYEIGVHTFTHPDISTISPAQLRIELSATQLLLKSQLGIGTILFRPPYGIDAEPKSPQEVKPLIITSQLGYYTIGMQIDPGDWRKPGTQSIIDQTLNQLLSNGGNIILLHDGGGDRSQTVAALPGIIESIQARGYRFVAVSDLMDLSRSQVMPSVPVNEQLQTGVSFLGFSVFRITTNLSSVLFMVCTVIGIARMLFINLLAVIQWLRSDGRHYNSEFHPRVSVLVPAYNEAKIINRTVHSLLRSTYPNLEIIVIDDGSTDGTYSCIISEFSNEPRVRAYTKENGGKAQALNFGIQQATSEIFVVLDADTIILPNAIARLVQHMSDPRVCAVAGNAKVGNRINPLTRMQSLEYITSQNMDRRAFALLNCITVVPGAIGAWRKDLVIQVGGFMTDTLAEDADLTLNILRKGVRIEYEDQAIALTEAPENMRSFLKQRFRWIFGMLQTIWKQKDALFHPQYGTMGMIALPNILIFSIILPMISPLMDLTFLWSLISWGWYRFQHPTDLHIDYLIPVLEFYAFFLLVDLLSTMLAFIMESSEDWSLILWMFPQRLFYRQLMYYTAIKAILTAIRGQLVGWGKLERKGTVKL